jgi:hypothetical protein
MTPDKAQVTAPRAARPLETPEHALLRIQEEGEFIDLRPYLTALRERWLTIAAVTALAAVIAGTTVNLVLPKWYRATAVVRPISTSAIESKISGLVGGLGGGGLGGLASSLAGSGSDAEEYVAILHGFRFNVALAQRHDLTDELLKPGLLGFMRSKPKDRDWAVHRVLESRFDSELSIKTGNLTLTFEAKSRSDAERILGYFIADLLDLLRTREIRDATSAIDSLEAEAASTPDPMLRAQLYELVAKQVARKKTAQVEADFAFRVLDPPAASDLPSRPNVMLDMMIAALLGFLFAIWLVMRSGTPRVDAGR